MELVISTELHDRLTHHLENTFPSEGGGFLVGHIKGDTRQVTEVHLVENTFASEEQFHRYLAEAGAFQRIEDEADARGLSLLGYFHSHPDHPAIPSEFDRTHAWPYFAYLIVSVRGGKRAESRLWELAANRESFIEGQLSFSQAVFEEKSNNGNH